MILGTVQLGMDYGIANSTGKPSEDEAFSLLDCAWEGGVRLLDTAAGYGTSEELIARYLTGHPKRFQVATKLSVALEHGDREAVSTNVRERLESLGVDDLWCCYFHRFEQCEDPTLVEGLVDARREGLTRHCGVSIYEPEELLFIAGHVSKSIDVVQIPLNLLSYGSWIDALARARESGIHILARSVFLQGLLLLEPSNPKVIALGASPYLERFRALAQVRGESPASLAYGFARSVPEVVDVIIGCETREQVEQNLHLEQDCDRLTSGELEEIVQLFGDVPKSVLNPSLWEGKR